VFVWFVHESGVCEGVRVAQAAGTAGRGFPKSKRRCYSPCSNALLVNSYKYITNALFTAPGTTTVLVMFTSTRNVTYKYSTTYTHTSYLLLADSHD